MEAKVALVVVVVDSGMAEDVAAVVEAWQNGKVSKFTCFHLTIFSESLKSRSNRGSIQSVQQVQEPADLYDIIFCNLTW